ncbi:MAG: DUF29 domain-containing protein [Alphaproteobacteria bacterium]|nr:DUF29 domain-containing protein [Alphaproteobacteria bacterium]
MPDLKPLYDEDFVLWSEHQAEALRATARGGSNQLIDWENVAEEIGDLAKSERRGLRNQIRRIIVHLVKLEHSPATEPRPGWRESIGDARVQIEDILDDSPSLRRSIEEVIRHQTERGVRLAIADLEDRGELSSSLRQELKAKSYLDIFAYTPEQILGDWFPREPTKPARRGRQP